MQFELWTGGKFWLPGELVDQLDEHLSRGRYLAAVRTLADWQEQSGLGDGDLLEIIEQRRRHWWPGAFSGYNDE